MCIKNISFLLSWGIAMLISFKKISWLRAPTLKWLKSVGICCLSHIEFQWLLIRLIFSSVSDIPWWFTGFLLMYSSACFCENSGTFYSFLKGLSDTIKICLNSSVNWACNSDALTHLIFGYGNLILLLLGIGDKCPFWLILFSCMQKQKEIKQTKLFTSVATDHLPPFSTIREYRCQAFTSSTVTQKSTILTIF